MKSKSFNLDTHLNDAVKDNFLIFLLEKWKISSGEFIGQPFSLKDSPYLFEFIQDNHPFKVVLKAAQMRISELMIAETIWNACFGKGNCLYTFPAGEQIQDFVAARPRSAIMNNQFLQEYVTGALNLKRFSLNKNTIYFRGVQRRSQMISVDASKLYSDEVDAYEDDSAIYTLNKRLGNAVNPSRRYFSTPSFHANGVSLYYYGSEAQRERGSDQKVWTIKCQSCGKHNEDLLWEENVIDLNEKDAKFSFYVPDVHIICRHCKKELNRLLMGEWVAKFPKNSEYCHGYHISKLFSPNADLNTMWLDSHNPLKEQEFYNSDLGMPYEPSGSRILDANIDSCRGSHQILVKSTEYNYAGVDRGNILYGVCGHKDDNGKLKLINASQFNDIDELALWFKDFNVKTAVLDMNPDKDEAVDFQKTQQNVWLAYFSTALERTADKFTKNFDDSIVAINRTFMMMLVSDMVVNKNVVMPIDIRRVKDFYDHLKSPIKAQKNDVNGNPITFYPKTKNPDHYYFAMLYWMTAFDLKIGPARFLIKNMSLHKHGN